MRPVAAAPIRCRRLNARPVCGFGIEGADRPAAARAHEPDPEAPRSRRRGHAPGAGHRPRAHAPCHHRPRYRRPADVQRGRLGGRGLQRRDLQLPRPARRAARARPPLPLRIRHRGDRPCLGGMGRGVRRAPARHVRVRALGRAPEGAVPGARPARHQAASPRHPAGRPARVRLRAEGAAGAPRPAAADRSVRGGGLPRLRLRARSEDDLSRTS